MSKQRRYEAISDDAIEIGKIEHKDFILNFQKSILLALIEKGLLTQQQFDRCMKIFAGQAK
jgi:hypothetical protein